MDHWTIPWNEMRKAIRRHNRPTDQKGRRRDDYLAAVEAAGKVMIAWATDPRFETYHIDRMLIGLQHRLQSMIDYDVSEYIPKGRYATWRTG